MELESQRLLRIGAIIAATIALVILIFRLPYLVSDFHDFYMAGQRLGNGLSPYTWERYYNPLWVAAPFALLARLPEIWAYRLFTLISLVVYLWATWKMSSDHLIRILTLLMPFLFVQINWGNLDTLLMAAVWVPAPLGLFLALMKPQVGGILAIVVLREIWHSSRRKGLWWSGLIGGALGLSWIMGLHLPEVGAVQQWNLSLFPWLLPLGLYGAWQAVRRQDRALALASALCLSPYWSLPSLVVALPWAARRRSTTLGLLILSWMLLTHYLIATFQFVAGG